MIFTGNSFQGLDNNGNPLIGGVVRFFEPETNTPKDVYADGLMETSIGNAVTLDSAGRATMFLKGDYKVVLQKANGVEIRTVDHINPQPLQEQSGLINASFEEENGIPGWVVETQGTGRVERVTDDSYSGAASVRITSDGTGGGQLETGFQLVTPGRQYSVSFATKASNATMHNTVQVRYFDENQTLVATESVYDKGSGNPVEWALFSPVTRPPETARYARIRVIGAQPGGSSGAVHFDEFAIDPLSNLIAQNTPTGQITMYGGTEDPIGWMICDGRALNRGDYAQLFAVLGTTYGSTSNTFNLPDMRGRVPIGAGKGSGLTDRSLGTALGKETHTLSLPETPDHDHLTFATGDSSDRLSDPTKSPTTGRNDTGDRDYAIGQTSSDPTAGRTTSQGGGQAHNNMQPSLVMNFIVKL